MRSRVVARASAARERSRGKGNLCSRYTRDSEQEGEMAEQFPDWDLRQKDRAAE